MPIQGVNDIYLFSRVFLFSVSFMLVVVIVTKTAMLKEHAIALWTRYYKPVYMKSIRVFRMCGGMSCNSIVSICSSSSPVVNIA